MIEINGLEASAILFAFDHYYETDHKVKVQKIVAWASRPQLQAIRDKLFGAHEHPEEPEGTFVIWDK